MNRSEFIKSLGLGASGLILPKNLLARSDVKIYDNYVKGLQHYQFKKVEKLIQEGDKLTLKRDMENIYDAFAVEVYYNELKLGYLPAFENIVIANMLDAKVELNAFVSYFKNEKNPYKSETLGVEVFVNLIAPTSKLITELKNARASNIEDIYRNGYNF